MIDIKLVDHSTLYSIYYIPDAKSKLEEYLSKLIDYTIDNYKKLENSDFLDWLYDYLELSDDVDFKEYLKQNKKHVVDIIYERITEEAIDTSVGDSRLVIDDNEVNDEYDIFNTNDYVLNLIHQEFKDIFPIKLVLKFESWR